MTVKLITLKTTQTIIADVIDETLSEYKVKTPVQIIMQTTNNGDIGLGFAPFLEFAEEFKVTGILIPKESVLTTNTPVKELLNQYNRVFGSGIEIASNMPNL